MSKSYFNWTLSHSSSKDHLGTDVIPAKVPGSVQLDYAAAKNYAPYHYGLNFKQFDWMEDEYFFYDTELYFNAKENETALLCFEGIDYKYEISINSQTILQGEGIFTPQSIDVTKYSGKKSKLRVSVYPIPKRFAQPQNRSQASACCKPPSSYGWDWHPRLVPSGIIEPAYLDIIPCGSPRNLEVSYKLSEDLKAVTVKAQTKLYGDGELTCSVISPQGEIICSQKRPAKSGEIVDFQLDLKDPLLWYPRGYGDQPRYLLKVSGADTVERKIGFRRSELVLNDGAVTFESGFPKGPPSAPMQIIINKVKVFAKGSNWVNTEIFPSLATEKRYDELIKLAYDNNMNIFRMWGGQYINHEYFYDKCDELGIMVWQEFMLSCNLYPDDDIYLSVLEQEAKSIIKRLRTHPCLTFWCGGNELFNFWSGMTQQAHALRLLDKLCYEHDRYTPFNMTSPLYGVTHGSYVKAVIRTKDRLAGNFSEGHEFICDVKNTKSNAYTEFGCNGASPKEYILKYVMDGENYLDCNENNDYWREHHAFKAWNESSWIGIPDVAYYFGGHESVDDLIDKSIYLQDLCYKTMFEEMRRQAPLCAMAINWDFNEPWPSAAGNSLVNWPAEPKSALKAVGCALRPTLASLELDKNRFLSDEILRGTVWVLNDNSDVATEDTVEVYLITDGKKTKLCQLSTEEVEPRSNKKFSSFELKIPKELPERFKISLECQKHPQWNSEYDLVHNKVFKTSVSYTKGEDDEKFSDFLK